MSCEPGKTEHCIFLVTDVFLTPHPIEPAERVEKFHLQIGTLASLAPSNFTSACAFFAVFVFLRPL